MKNNQPAGASSGDHTQPSLAWDGTPGASVSACQRPSALVSVWVSASLRSAYAAASRPVAPGVAAVQAGHKSPQATPRMAL